MYLVVILPIILLGVYLYNWSYKNASDEISRNTLAQLSTYLEDLNREIEWLEIQQYDVVQESDLNRLAVTWELMDSVDKKKSIDYMLHRLTSIKSNSAYVKDIYIHIRTIGKTLSEGNGVLPFDQDRYNALRLMLDENDSRLTTLDDTLQISSSRFGGKKGAEPLFIVQIELDSEKLRESLKKLNVYEESGSILLAEGAGFTLYSDRSAYSRMNEYWESAEASHERSMLLDIEGKRYHFDRADSDKLKLSVVSYLPEETVKRPLTKFSYWAWGFALTTGIAIILYAFITYRFVHRPLLLLIQGFRRMESGSLDLRINHGKKDEFGFLYSRFNNMLDKLQALIDQDFKQKMMMQKAELKQLQSQINPHFLYNSFFILNSLAQTGDTERIEQFTNMLGEYFRFITRNGQENVLLSEEIKHARTYTEIQKLRFSRRIKVQFDELPPEMERIRVPRLIVQPIIENAYEHSLEKMPEEGFLRVTFELHASEARIVIEDNGGSMDEEQLEMLNARLTSTGETEEMTGMINIHRRMMLTYGEGSGLQLTRTEQNGLRVTICMKLKEEMGHV
ncbi:histidine kinase [Paenibacillus sp. CCS19]|uniref:sensor histidine kinase n=1 Tax=Paenibacillus sp. CCS19 TaxID=3158387 RepID=UPI00295EA5D4|nr:histidine kinase [Paenibacillus cellulosilyticus]